MGNITSFHPMMIPALIACGFALFCFGMMLVLAWEFWQAWLRGKDERDAARFYRSVGEMDTSGKSTSKGIQGSDPF